MAVEGTGRCVVTNDPVLIEITAGSCRERVAPGEAAVCGTARDHSIAMDTAGLQQRQRGNQPDAVSGIVGDGWIGRAVIGATADPLRNAGQQTTRPRGAIVGRSGEAGGTGTAIVDAA